MPILPLAATAVNTNTNYSYLIWINVQGLFTTADMVRTGPSYRAAAARADLIARARPHTAAA
jgi:hypothetical protein